MGENVNALFQRFKESGDIAIRNQIAEKYLYIAEILAKKFVGRGVEYDDLYQVAAFALLRGIDRSAPRLECNSLRLLRPRSRVKLKIISVINRGLSNCLEGLGKSAPR